MTPQSCCEQLGSAQWVTAIALCCCVQMVEVFATQPKLREVALDPFVPRLARMKIMGDLMKDSGATEVTKRLFLSLAEENAIAATLQISNSYDELMLAHKKEVYCTIVTAEPMDKLEKVRHAVPPPRNSQLEADLPKVVQ